MTLTNIAYVTTRNVVSTPKTRIDAISCPSGTQYTKDMPYRPSVMRLTDQKE